MRIKKSNAAFLLFASSIILYLTAACSPKNEKQSDELPGQGSLYLSTNGSGTPEFVKLNFNGKKITGKVYKEQDQNKWYNSFGGEVISDSLIQVHVAFQDAELLENWVLENNRKTITIKNMMGRASPVIYSKIQASEMPDTTLYIFAGDVDPSSERGSGDTVFNAPSFCFYTYSPSGLNRRITYREYVQMWQKNNRIFGWGAGSAEGFKDWRFIFEAKNKNDTLLDVNVIYKLSEGNELHCAEKWRLTSTRESLNIRGPGPDSVRVYMKAIFHAVKCDIPPDNFISSKPSNKEILETIGH